MIQTIPQKRLTCPRCLRPQSACICHWITRIDHQIEVLILQHPQEVHHPKGTARLLHLCLPHSRLIIGEVFGPADLQHWLTASWAHAVDTIDTVDTAGAVETHSPANPCTSAPVLTLLLYPDTASDPVLALPAAHPKSRLRLVVLDGTWRKSRKMLYANPLLQALPRLALLDLPASAYRLRSAPRPHQRSTLEATCAALIQLEHQEALFAPLLHALDGFVAQQLALQSESGYMRCARSGMKL